jgi:hypothetical protein
MSVSGNKQNCCNSYCKSISTYIQGDNYIYGIAQANRNRASVLSDFLLELKCLSGTGVGFSLSFLGVSRSKIIIPALLHAPY